jgi:hypothetical protein
MKQRAERIAQEDHEGQREDAKPEQEDRHMPGDVTPSLGVRDQVLRDAERRRLLRGHRENERVRHLALHVRGKKAGEQERSDESEQTRADSGEDCPARATDRSSHHGGRR